MNDSVEPSKLADLQKTQELQLPYQAYTANAGVILSLGLLAAAAYMVWWCIVNGWWNAPLAWLVYGPPILFFAMSSKSLVTAKLLRFRPMLQIDSHGIEYFSCAKIPWNSISAIEMGTKTFRMKTYFMMVTLNSNNKNNVLTKNFFCIWRINKQDVLKFDLSFSDDKYAIVATANSALNFYKNFTRG